MAMVKWPATSSSAPKAIALRLPSQRSATIAAHQRQQIDQGGVGGVLAVGEGVVEQEVFGQVEDQQAAHAVVGEPLPHLGEEQHDQAARVAGAAAGRPESPVRTVMTIPATTTTFI